MTTFETVTETWSLPASPKQLSMAYTRYRLAGDLVQGKRVLELGCGSGMGLSYLEARGATFVVGGDYTASLLRDARRHVPKAIVARLDAQQLPFQDESFDIVLMLEMIYYLKDLNRAFSEATRVLKPGGYLVIAEPNPGRMDFNPSEFSTYYPSASELAALFAKHGLHARIYGAFPLTPSSKVEAALDKIRRLAVRRHLIPRSMKAKALVKRAIYRRMERLTGIKEGMAAWHPPIEVDTSSKTSPEFAVLYGVGQRSPDRLSGP